MPRPKAHHFDDGPKPKGQMNPYAFFVQVCREEHKRRYPEEHVPFPEFSKKCAERWKTMTAKEKGRFNKMADADKDRYRVEMASYNAKNKGKRKRKPKDPNAPKRSM